MMKQRYLTQSKLAWIFIKERMNLTGEDRQLLLLGRVEKKLGGGASDHAPGGA
uniref:Uncharacterized protein MANES_03G136800 n=1 Tax=Rhizophora mucronata TaxID=61149 RepID=A0A2P2LEB5_RHIMU